VWAESEGEGRGATFTLRLPHGGPAPTPRPGAHRRAEGDGDAEPLAGVRVLVVEDEADSRQLLAAVLERAGAFVRAEGSARAGLEALDAEGFDLIVSDIGMPGDDGFSFLRAVRTRTPERGGSTPAAALTAYTRQEDRRRAAEAGFQAYLTKPFDSGSLCEALRTLALGPPPSGARGGDGALGAMGPTPARAPNAGGPFHHGHQGLRRSSPGSASGSGASEAAPERVAYVALTLKYIKRAQATEPQRPTHARRPSKATRCCPRPLSSSIVRSKPPSRQ
jgi:CheY-like chemotaxis protein